jgi:hypothetical protein
MLYFSALSLKVYVDSLLYQFIMRVLNDNTLAAATTTKRNPVIV